MPVSETGNDRLHHQLVTWAAQIPLLFYAVHGAFSLFSPNGAMAVAGSTAGDFDSEAGSVRIVAWVCTMLALLMMFPILNRALTICNRNRSITALITLATLSILWSQDPGESLQKDVYLIVTTCFGYYLVERFTPRQLMRVFMITGWISIVGSFALAVAAPRYGIFTGRTDAASGWQGIYSHKNTLGMMAVYFLAPALFLPAKGLKAQLSRVVYIVGSLLLIAMSRSRGAWIIGAALIAFGLVIAWGRKLSAGQRHAAYWALGVSMVVAAIAGSALLPLFLGLLNKDITLTGRTTIWAVLLTSFAKQPWFGFGYGAFWVGARGESINAINAIHWARLSYAENGVLELALEIGLVGVFLYFLAYAENYRRLRQLLTFTNGTPELFWYASILFLAAITNIEAGYIAGSNGMEWLVFVVITASIQKAHHAMRLQQHNSQTRMTFTRPVVNTELLEAQ